MNHMKQFQIRPKDSIATKLLKIIFSIYITVAIIVTCIQLGVEYFHVKYDVLDEVENLQESFYSSLNEALWKFDEDQLKSLLKGVWENQAIVEVRINNHQKEGDPETLGWIIDSLGHFYIIRQENKEFFQISKGKLFSELIVYEFPFKYIDEYSNEYDLGKGIFYSSNQVIIDRIKYGFILIIINSVVKTFALWIIFLLVVRRLLIRPLVDLTENVAKIDPENIEQVDFSIKTIGRNELKILEEVFLNMIQKLFSAHKKLEHYSLHLEELVEQRTAELEKTNEELERLATIDPLTGLLNRRAIEPILDKEMNRRKRFNHPVSFLLLDLDHFKQINDEYGHAAGDEVLSKVAETVKFNIRTTDNVARWGGEEFVVVAANTNVKHAVMLGEKIRKAIMSIHFKGIRTVTASVGVAEYHPDEDFQHWYECADSALYKAKDGGRNRVLADQYVLEKELSKGEILKVAWNDDFYSGHTVIDEQHIELFDQANHFIDAILTDVDNKTINTMLANMFIALKKHFVCEERILEQAKYPKLKSHADAHHKLETKLDKLIADFREDTIDAMMFIKFISQELVTGHLVTDDKDYFDWLNSHSND